jgi:hypothetical protein
MPVLVARAHVACPAQTPTAVEKPVRLPPINVLRTVSTVS